MSREKGNEAEDQAADFLQKNGFKIISRNFFARVGEIDIVAERNGIYSFVEVKERSYGEYGGAASAITKNKLEKILKAAKIYLYENNLLNKDWRIDAVLINGKNEPELVDNIYTEGMR